MEQTTKQQSAMAAAMPSAETNDLSTKASDYNLQMVNGLVVIKVPIDSKITNWPLFTMEDPQIICFAQYTQQQERLVDEWCFFYGAKNSDSGLVNKCKTHKTCALVKSAILDKGALATFACGCRDDMEKRMNKRKKLKRSFSEDDSKVILLVWPQIKGSYVNCVSVVNQLELYDNGNADVYNFQLNKSIQNSTWLKMNATLCSKQNIEDTIKYDSQEANIISIDKNQMQVLPYTRFVDATKEVHLGTINNRNVRVEHEEDSQFTLIKLSYDNASEVFKGFVECVMYGEGYNKCILDQPGENEMTFLGRIQNMCINLPNKIKSLAERFGVDFTFSNEKPLFHQIETIELYSSCLVYENDKVNVEIDGVMSVDDLKQFVVGFVDNYNVKVVDIKFESTQDVETGHVYLTKVFCTVIGLPVKIVRKIIQEAKNDCILNKCTC